MDNYIVHSANIWDLYKNDIFFQYTYIYLGVYQYDNKEKFINYFKKLYQSLYDLDITLVKNVIKQLQMEKKIRLEIDNEQLYITNQLQMIFQNKEIIEIINKKLNDKERFCNILGSCINDIEELIESIIFAIFVLKHLCNTNELISILKKEEDVYEYIINTICSYCKIKDRNVKEEKYKFLNYTYKNLIVDGYYLHGTNSINIKNILTKGFSSVHIPIMSKEIKEINSIFENYNLFMNFEGKMRELKLHQYYVTDFIKSSVMYAFQSPEYLSRFCSNGYHMEDIYIYDREAFWRRDYNACRRNIELLCDEYRFKEKDKNIVLSNFQKLWNSNVKIDEPPAIFIGKRKNIGRDFSQKLKKLNDNIEEYSLKDILYFFKLGDNIHDKRLSFINKESLSYFSLPNINKMYMLKSSDKYSSNQYVMYNNKKYNPDIIIFKSPLHNKCIIIDDEAQETQRLNDKVFILSVRNAVVKVNNYCDINFDILIAESGKALTKKGSNYIKQKREEFKIKSIIDYNKKLIDNCINYWYEKNNVMQSEEKMKFVHFLLNQLVVKTMAMKKYNKYFVDIDAALIRLIYFSIDKSNKLNRIVKQNITDDNFVEQVMNNIIESIKSDYKSYYNLKGIFYDIEPK